MEDIAKIKERIISDLKAIGIRRGDILLLHGSLFSLGYKGLDPEIVVDAFLEVLAKEGTLMVATFTYSRETYFDPLNSPSKTGKITEALRRREQAIRSLHPTHSVAAIGRYAEELVKDHLYKSPIGLDSPVDRLSKKGGKVLLLGVGHVSNSAVHVGEAYARMPYLNMPKLDVPLEAVVKLPDGKEITIRHKQMPGCSRTFGVVEMPLRTKGAIRDGKVGGATSQLMKAGDIIEATLALLKDKPDILLCTDSSCKRCLEAKKRINLSKED